MSKGSTQKNRPLLLVLTHEFHSPKFGESK
nr:MAG TPA: hypothetical protein [Caudoviricetes sp.]